VFCNITAETTSITIPTITTPQPTDELVLTKNNLLKTLPTIGKEFVVSFDVYINKFGSSWQSVVHLTSTGREKGGSWGDRVPAVWISARKTFHICSALNGNGNTCFDGGSPNAGEWISVEISQTLTNGKFMYEIKINKQSVYRVENTRAQEFNNVKVFAGNSVYNSLDGKIRNLLIENVSPQLPTPQPPIIIPPPQPPIIGPPSHPPIIGPPPSFHKGKELVLKKNNLLKTLPTIGKEFTVSFDVYINKFGPSWQNIIHLTSTGRDCCNWGDRVPAAWISSKKQFYICSAINGGGDTCYHGTVANAREWISVHISQTLNNGKFVYEIKINGKSVYKKDNNKAEEFKNVNVFAADNFYNSLDGKIRNLLIRNQTSLTLSSYKYEYLPWEGKTFHFKVKTQNDAHILLAPAPDSDGNEIVIGGWGNQKSVVRRGKQGRSISNGLTQTNSILSSSEFRGFWIETYLDDNERVIKVGKEGESVPFMTGVDPDPLDINYVALSAWAGLSATYVF